MIFRSNCRRIRNRDIDEKLCFFRAPKRGPERPQAASFNHSMKRAINQFVKYAVAFWPKHFSIRGV
jgi:hypothetical protein